MIQIRRYPCPGKKCTSMIWRSYPHGVMTYQVGTSARCRKCARKANREHEHKEYLKRREKNKTRRIGNSLKIILPRMAKAAKEQTDGIRPN
jgi:hypothetical protein